MVRKAVMDDFPVILNIYATARAFMAKTGNPTQWADGHPSADLLWECILAQKLFVFTDPDDFSQIRGCFYFARNLARKSFVLAFCGFSKISEGLPSSQMTPSAM